MDNPFDTKAGRTDARYRAWITDLNWSSLMNTGVGIDLHTTLTPRMLRRWYLAGVTPYDALKKAQTVK